MIKYTPIIQVRIVLHKNVKTYKIHTNNPSLNCTTQKCKKDDKIHTNNTNLKCTT